MKGLALIKKLFMPARALFDRVQSWVQKIRGGKKITSKEEVRPEDAPVLLADLPSWDDLHQHLLTFPERYRELFLPKPLENLKLFVGRESEHQVFKKVIKSWRQRRTVMVAVVGADGSGKTTFLNRLEEDLSASDKVARISIDKRVRSEEDLIGLLTKGFGINTDCQTVDELASRLAKLPRRVVLVDNGHNLMLRVIGATKVVKGFLAILLATRGRLLWVVSFKDHAWRRLDYQYGLASSFTNLIRIPYFSEEEMRAALSLRLDASGLILAGTGDPAPTADGDYTLAEDMTEKKTALDRFGSELFSLSRGNMFATLFYWGLSTQYDEAVRGVKVQPFKSVDHSLLRELADIYQFTLAELLVHGGLTPEEHGELFQCDQLESRLILDYLIQQRLVLKAAPTGGDIQDIYRVDPIFYTLVSSTLESAHILY